MSRSVNLIFFQVLGAGLAVLAIISFLAIKFYPIFSTLWSGLAQQLTMICGCANHWHFANHPIIFSFFIGVGLIATVLFCFVLFKTGKMIWQTRRFVKDNLKKKKRGFSFKLSRIVRQVGLAGQITEIKKDQPIVFCHGFFQPRICVSAGLVNRLSETELRAVLLHEKYHLLSREPIKTLVVKILAAFFFFLPGFSSLAKKYLAYAELAADEHATVGFREKMPLARALYKTIKCRELMAIKQQLALSFFSQVTEERINKLADSAYIPKIKVLNWKMIFSSAVFVLVIFSFWSVLNSPMLALAEKETSICLATPVAGSHHREQCVLEMPNNSCLIPNYSLSANDSCG